MNTAIPLSAELKVHEVTFTWLPELGPRLDLYPCAVCYGGIPVKYDEECPVRGRFGPVVLCNFRLADGSLCYAHPVCGYRG